MTASLAEKGLKAQYGKGPNGEGELFVKEPMATYRNPAADRQFLQETREIVHEAHAKLGVPLAAAEPHAVGQESMLADAGKWHKAADGYQTVVTTKEFDQAFKVQQQLAKDGVASKLTMDPKTGAVELTVAGTSSQDAAQKVSRGMSELAAATPPAQEGLLARLEHNLHEAENSIESVAHKLSAQLANIDLSHLKGKMEQLAENILPNSKENLSRDHQPQQQGNSRSA